MGRQGGKIIRFTRVEPLSGTKFIQAEAETKEDIPQKVLVVFGPEHAPLEQRQVEDAWQEACALKPDMLLLYVRSNTDRVSSVKKSGNQ